MERQVDERPPTDPTLTRGGTRRPQIREHADTDGTRPKNQGQRRHDATRPQCLSRSWDTSVNGVQCRFGDSHGRIKRSEGANDSFKRLHPCPTTRRSSGPRPEYVIDHIVPLCASEPNAPYNMQWQTTPQSKEKNRWERTQCNAVPKR